jgi:hypothetical protein
MPEFLYTIGWKGLPPDLQKPRAAARAGPAPAPRGALVMISGARVVLSKARTILSFKGFDFTKQTTLLRIAKLFVASVKLATPGRTSMPGFKPEDDTILNLNVSPANS